MPRRRPGFTFLELLVVLFICVLLLALLLPGLALARQHAEAVTAAPGLERNWKQFPAVAQIEDAPLLYAIGDIHSDYDKAVKILAAAKLLKSNPARPEDAKWAGGSAVLVCTGDMIDKGPQGVEVVRMMRALQKDAASAGGRVIVTLGNHEAEFLGAGGENQKAAGFAGQLRAQKLDPSLVAAGRDDEGLGAWMRSLPAAAKVNDWFFSHAGNTHGQTVAQIESAVEDGVGKEGFSAPVLADGDSILEARMHPVPWWDNAKTTGLARLRDNAAALGCQHLVAGHQPGAVKFSDQIERPRGDPYEYQGALFLIDTGMSRGVDDGKPAVLKIDTGKHESARIIDSSGTQSLLWEQK